MKLSPKQLLGKIEDYLDSGTSGAKATKIVLAIVALTAIAGIVATAPNIFTNFSKRKSYKHFSNKRYNIALNALKRRNYIEKSASGGISLTSKGNRQLNRIILEDINVIKPVKWDGKWRMFLFDIPIRFKKGRNALRFKIKDMGFLQFQKSVWIYPYPCEKEIDLVASFFGVTKHFDLFTVTNIAREHEFIRKFKL